MSCGEGCGCGIVHPDHLVIFTKEISTGSQYSVFPDASYILWARLSTKKGAGGVGVILFSTQEEDATGTDERDYKLGLSTGIHGEADETKEFTPGIYCRSGIFAECYGETGVNAYLTVAMVRRREYCCAFPKPEEVLAKCWADAAGRSGTNFPDAFDLGDEEDDEWAGGASLGSAGSGNFYSSGGGGGGLSDGDYGDITVSGGGTAMDIDAGAVGLTELGALTTNGDLLYYNAGHQRLAIGSNGQVLTISGGVPTWSTPVIYASTAAGLSQFLGNGNWKVFYSDGSGDAQELALGAAATFLRSAGAAAAPAFAAASTVRQDLGVTNVRQITVVIGDGTNVITAGTTAEVKVEWGGTITQNTLVSRQLAGTSLSGSIVLDIWKDTYANWPPTVADTITASAKPTLSSAIKSQDSTLTGWTTTITAGDHLVFVVDSVTTCTQVILTLKVTVTGA